MGSLEFTTSRPVGFTSYSHKPTGLGMIRLNTIDKVNDIVLPEPIRLREYSFLELGKMWGVAGRQALGRWT
jgi:hypothetical protein